MLIPAIIFLIFLASLPFWLKKNTQGQTVDYSPKVNFADSNTISPSDLVIKITDNGFVPDKLSLKKGQKIYFLNSSGKDAWPASDPHPIHNNYPELDPKEPLRQNKAWAFQFEKIGTWGVHDHLWPSHRAILTVTE